MSATQGEIMEEEVNIAMVRRQCKCGNHYWVIEEEDDGICNACLLANDQEARLIVLNWG
jgi:hypothetical protein